ncbi:MAG: PD-(D/E)XK nuclease family protein [Bifidobacteriaceae bacterium]|nr:PD-(D/E)XK nuclease family protein [Bifidobacteriaceae bacterium]
MTLSLPQVVLAPPRVEPPLPVPDAAQAAAVELIAQGGPVAVAGAPGTGKTLVALTAAVAALRSGRRAIVLSPTRATATALNARIVRQAGLTVQGRAAMTPSAFAMALLKQRADRLAAAAGPGEEAAAARYQPQMISGAEQDAAIASMLAAQAEGEGRAIAWPDSVPPAARRIKAFRNELRDLLVRAAQRGLTPPDLAELGRRQGRPEWVAAAQFYDAYLEGWALRGGGDVGLALDESAMVAQAANQLAAWDEPVWLGDREVVLELAERPRFDLVLVDDFQEASLALWALLGELEAAGSQVVVLGCPDIAVQGFRGALPRLLGEAMAPPPQGMGAQLAVLGTAWRQAPALFEATARVCGAIRPGLLGSKARGARPAAAAQKAPESVPPLRSLVAGSEAEAATALARHLRVAHLRDGVPWDEMAVLTRTAGQVVVLRAALAGAGVPVYVPGSEVLSTDQPVVAALLAALGACVEPEKLDGAAALALAASPLGGLDAVQVRALRRHLKAAEVEAGGNRPSDELVAAALRGEVELGMVPGEVGAKARRLAAVLAAGREAAARPAGATAGQVLWALWDGAGLAGPWREAALAGGPAGEAADADLDAVLALFAAAERFDARRAGAGARGFADYLAAQQVPADTVAKHAPQDGRVVVSTVTAAAGREWDLVALAGLQEDVWPNLRLRDTLMGAGELADLVDGKPGAGDYAERRRAVLDDELRLAALAVSRAKRQLLVTAVENADTRPSQLVELIDPGCVVPDGAWPRPGQELPHDLRGLVAQTRRGLVEQAAGDGAAQVLAVLAAVGVPGAHPEDWAGTLPPSTDRPLAGEEEELRLSPSRVEALVQCPLRWLLERAGGRGEAGVKANLGSLVHALAEQFPQAGPEEMQAHLAERWAELGLPDTYSNRLLYQGAMDMARRLGLYLQADPAALATELRFEYEADGVVVRGVIDRLEEAGQVDGQPAARVVDFKTGSAINTMAQARVNPQLGIYQAAIEAGAVPGVSKAAGATLVYLANDSGKATERHQPPLDQAEDPAWVDEMLAQCRDRAAAARFQACPGTWCRTCQLVPACPAQPGGEAVTA